MSTSKGNIEWSQIRSDNKQGTGELGQSATGAFTAGHVLVYDADGNAIDGGTPSGTGTVTNAAALTADQPVFGDGANAAKVGTKSGTTNEVMTASGAFTAGHILVADASGNAIDGGAPSSGGTVTNTGTLTANQLIKGNGGVDITVGDLTGDVTTSGTMATTLANVNAGSGTTGDASHVAQITTNAKGLTTSQSSVAIALSASAITSGLLALARGGTNADLSATGGTSQVLKQATAGAAITVAQLAFTDVSGAATLAQLPATAKVRGFGATFDGGGAALVAGKTVYMTIPYAATITAWNITVDTGTCTIDIWKIASGTAIPTIANTITASALPAISSGTAIHSTTLTSWTTSIMANDIVGINLKIVSGATFVNIVIEADL